MSNTNCLEGIRCPKCGHEDGFYVEAIVTLHVNDNGTEDRGGEHFWDDDSNGTCDNYECDYDGPWRTFRVENQSRKGGAA